MHLLKSHRRPFKVVAVNNNNNTVCYCREACIALVDVMLHPTTYIQFKSPGPSRVLLVRQYTRKDYSTVKRWCNIKAYNNTRVMKHNCNVVISMLWCTIGLYFVPRCSRVGSVYFKFKGNSWKLERKNKSTAEQLKLGIEAKKERKTSLGLRLTGLSSHCPLKKNPIAILRIWDRKGQHRDAVCMHSRCPIESRYECVRGALEVHRSSFLRPSFALKFV